MRSSLSTSSRAHLTTTSLIHLWRLLLRFSRMTLLLLQRMKSSASIAIAPWDSILPTLWRCLPANLEYPSSRFPWPAHEHGFSVGIVLDVWLQSLLIYANKRTYSMTFCGASLRLHTGAADMMLPLR